jgi:hypothetical protein
MELAYRLAGSLEAEEEARSAQKEARLHLGRSYPFQRQGDHLRDTTLESPKLRQTL